MDISGQRIVTVSNGWTVSVSLPSLLMSRGVDASEPKWRSATIGAFKGDPFDPERHELDGKVFMAQTQAEAEQQAWDTLLEAGLTKIHVSWHQLIANERGCKSWQTGISLVNHDEARERYYEEVAA